MTIWDAPARGGGGTGGEGTGLTGNAAWLSDTVNGRDSYKTTVPDAPAKWDDAISDQLDNWRHSSLRDRIKEVAN